MPLIMVGRRINFILTALTMLKNKAAKASQTPDQASASRCSDSPSADPCTKAGEATLATRKTKTAILRYKRTGSCKRPAVTCTKALSMLNSSINPANGLPSSVCGVPDPTSSLACFNKHMRFKHEYEYASTPMVQASSTVPRVPQAIKTTDHATPAPAAVMNTSQDDSHAPLSPAARGTTTAEPTMRKSRMNKHWNRLLLLFTQVRR
mmetsp:Transcript_29822/g.76584  ORF Transcript_29822/g.76584 Transcript_29822/m.76584 type:complete len:207 (+) Transcript_29822:202-822(+)